MWRETLTFCEAFICSYSANGNSGQIKQNLIENLKNVFLFPACNPPWYNQEEIQVHWWLLLWSWQILIKTGLYPKSNIYIYGMVVTIVLSRSACIAKSSCYGRVMVTTIVFFKTGLNPKYNIYHPNSLFFKTGFYHIYGRGVPCIHAVTLVLFQTRPTPISRVRDLLNCIIA